MPPRKRSSAYNVFRTVVGKRGLKLTAHDMASLYGHVSKHGIKVGDSDPLQENFADYFKTKMSERPDMDATDVVKNGFIRPESEGYKWMTAHLKDWTSRVKGGGQADRPPPAQYQQTQVSSDAVTGDQLETIQDRDTAKPVLRSRAIIAGPEVVQETPEQQTSDAVQSDLFSKKPRHDEDIGDNNLLALQEDFLEEHVRFRGPLQMPRASEGPNVMGHVIPTQWDESAGSSAVVFQMRDDIIDHARKQSLMHDSKSVALHPDNSLHPDPHGRASVANPFVPVCELPGAWEVPTLPAGSNDYLGLKSNSNTFRAELLPEQRSAKAFMPQTSQLAEYERNGPSILY